MNPIKTLKKCSKTHCFRPWVYNIEQDSSCSKGTLWEVLRYFLVRWLIIIFLMQLRASSTIEILCFHYNREETKYPRIKNKKSPEKSIWLNSLTHLFAFPLNHTI